MTRNEEIELRMTALGISRPEAEFIVAIELGEINGDMVILSPDGEEIPDEGLELWTVRK